MKEKKIFFIFFAVLALLAMLMQASEIHDAAQRADVKTIKELLAKDPGLVNARLTTSEDSLSYRKTPLHVAAEFGHTDVIRLLLEHKADINSRTAMGFTPLHFAAMSGHSAAARLLIEKGCKLNEKNDFNITPIFLAASKGHIEIVELLANKGVDIFQKGNNGMTLLHAAALGGSIETIIKLTDKKLDVNAQNVFGKTPLHFAAAQGHKGTVEILLAKGAIIDARSLDGRTPYNAAEANEQKEIVEFLRAKGADTASPKFPELEGDYLGQEEPGLTPIIFAPGIVSTDGAEFAGTFSPDGSSFYFTRSGGEEKLKTNTIMVTYRLKENGRWTEPMVASFSGKDFDFEPFITPGGKTLYFGSMRAMTEEEGKQNSLNQWLMQKTPTGWTEPKPLGPPFLNRLAIYVTAAKNGNIYFSGKEGIYVSRLEKEGTSSRYSEPELLSMETVNVFSYSAHPFIAPDESYLIFDAHPYGLNSDLFICFKKKNGTWKRAQKLDKGVNTEETEMCPSISPDGKYLFFARTKNIYWVNAGIIKNFKTATK